MTYTCESPRFWRDGVVVPAEELRKGDVITVENFHGGESRGFHLDPTVPWQPPARFRVGSTKDGVTKLTCLWAGRRKR